MNVNIILTCHPERISWIVYEIDDDGEKTENGFRCTGSDPLSSHGSDYMVMMSNIVNTLNYNWKVNNWEFLRG